MTDFFSVIDALKIPISVVLTIFVYQNSIAHSIEPNWALYDVEAYAFQEGLARSSSNKSYGYINSSGKVVIPEKFADCGSFCRGTAKVKDMDGQEGIIDYSGNYMLKPGDYEISTFDDAKGFYKIEQKCDGKIALFDGRVFLTDFLFDYIDCYGQYPFMSFSTQDYLNGPKGIMNLLTGEFFPKALVLSYGGYVKVLVKSDDTFAIYDNSGNPIDTKELKLSSKGNEVFKDDKSGLWGIRNAFTKMIVTAPKYRLRPRNLYNTLWRNDVVELYDSISPERKYESVILNQYGKVLFEKVGEDIIYDIDKEYILSRKLSDFFNPAFFHYYDFNGNELKELEGGDWIVTYPGVYFDSVGKRIYLRKTGRIIPNVRFARCTEGWVVYMTDDDEQYYVTDFANGVKKGPFSSVSLDGFREGLLVFKDLNGNKCLMGLNGKIYSYPEGIDLTDDCFSEGVICAYDESAGVRGFLYNPLGHEGWEYNQKEGYVDDYSLRHLTKEADGLFDKGLYAQAMDKYSLIMMGRPDSPLAFNNYAACLYNIGMYDESLTAVEVSLDYWPENEYALGLKKRVIDALRAQEEEEDDEEEIVEETKSTSSAWDILGRICGAMANVSGTFVRNYYQVQPSMNGATSASYGVGTSLQSQYSNWERRAESCYNSLTNLGYSSTSKSGQRHGGSGKGKVSSTNYIQQKRSLREAQQEMRKIRRKASSQNITIPQSRWETVTVEY